MSNQPVSVAKEKLIQNSQIDKLANVIATLILIVGIGIYAVRNLGNRYFWTDEATSLLTTLGWPPVGKFAEDLSSPRDVILGHIEPGMFNLIERFWALWVGTEIVALRAFPFLLFISYIVALLILSRVVGAPWFLGCAVVSLMLLENITPYYAIELRPSIAGLAATVVLPLVAIWLAISKSKLIGLVVFIPSFVIFGSMQYNTFPIIIGTAGILFIASFSKSVSSRRVLLRVTALVILLWLPFIYVVNVGNPFDLTGGDYFTNIPDVYLPNMPLDQAFRTIFTNLFSLTALPRTSFIILVPILWFAKKSPLPTRESSKVDWGINAVWIAVFLGTVMSALAGVLGFLPWVLGTRWSISEVGLIALSLVGLAGLIARSKLFKKRPVYLIVLTLSILLCLAGAFRMANYERFSGFNWNPTLQTLLSGEPGAAYVDNWSHVELRYWVEYSGQYDQFRDAWVKAGVQSVGGMDKASARDIEIFFASDADRLLLRNESLLEGIEVPSDIRIEPVESWSSDDAVSIDRPVLLVRE